MTGPQRVAVLSDVHGNVTAYRAVLADVAARGITTVLNLGDVVGKGPRGSQAVALTREHCAVTVRGNWDDFLPRPDPDRDPAMAWWHAELDDDDRAWLLGLPLVDHLHLSGRRIRLVHASAESPHVRVRARHTPEEFAGMFATTELTGQGPTPDVVLYGDIHATYLEVSGTGPWRTSAASGTRSTRRRRPTSSSRGRPAARARTRSASAWCGCRTTSRREIAAARALGHAGARGVRGRAADRGLPGPADGDRGGVVRSGARHSHAGLRAAARMDR